MGECLIVRRGGSVYKLPVLNENYPQDVAKTVVNGVAESATFNVLVTEAGTPAEYTYQWYENGVAVDGATNSSWTLSDLTEAAVHEVYCEVRNKAGVVTSRVATLSVTKNDVPILDTSYPLNVTGAEVGGSVTFTTKIVQHGTPAEYTYQWYVNGSAVIGATSASYTMSNLTKGTNTVYCKVTNSAGTVQSRTATLTVTKLPLFKSGNQCVENGGGWTADVWSHAGHDYASSMVTIGSNIAIKSSGSNFGVVGKENTVDMSDYSTLKFTVGTVLSRVRAFVTTKKDTAESQGGVLASAEAASTGIFSLNISAINQSAYVAFLCVDGQEATITSVWLE